MNKNSTFKDMIHITLANIVNLLSSILNGFVIPIVLGTLNYGYYKIFVLYASYETLTHFGFNDGMMLSLSGKHINDLNKKDCRSNIVFFSLFQLILSVIIICISFFIINPIYKVLCILLGFNNFATNILCYYQKISQSMLRFDEYSVVTVIQNLLLIVTVSLMCLIRQIYGLNHFNFTYYVIIIIIIQIILDLWYVYKYRKITFGIHTPIVNNLNHFKNYFRNGLYITFGWGIALLMFNLDSQFVVKLFSVKTYGIYAFAYSIISAILIILQAASPVLLPHLKRHSKRHILSKYSTNLSCIIMVVSLSMIGYFPLKILLFYMIPNYYSSLIYFRLLLPGMIITCSMNIIISSYYYAFNKMKFYFNISLLSLIISFVIDLCSYVIFKSPSALAFSSTISLMIWFIISNYYIVHWYHLKWMLNIVYLLFITVIFLLVSNIQNELFGSIIYLLLFILMSTVIYRKIFFNMIYRIINYIIGFI